MRLTKMDYSEICKTKELLCSYNQKDEKLSWKSTSETKFHYRYIVGTVVNFYSY